MKTKTVKFHCDLKRKSLFGIILLFFMQILNARAEDSIEDKFNSITPEQREMFNIKVTSWVNAVPDNPNTPADESFPGYAFIVGCDSCAGAEYNAAGLLTNSAELPIIPTSYLLRVPENWNGRVVVVIPPGIANQTFFIPFMVMLLNEGYAVAAMNQPEPGFPGFPYEDFIGPPYSTKDFRNRYLATGHQLKDLITAVFGEPAGTYAFGLSRGTLEGTQILEDESGTPFDGYVLGLGGNGLLNQLMSLAESYQAIPNRVPLTNLTPLLEITADQKANNLAGVPTIGIGTADPEYKAFILSGSTDEERLARALAYNASERPKKVQRAWAALEFGADIKRPTIFLKGLRDRVVYPGLALRYSERIAEAGKSSLLRLYLVRNMTHGGPIDTPAPPQTLFVDAVHKLDAWVQNGDEPGPLNASLLNSDAPDPVESCTIRGFGTDPLGCFCDEMGGVDFNGDPIPECD